MKAIQTRYAGCHFRSRLEARWAVFFDTVGIRWEYESQGYMCPYRLTLKDGEFPYLPDFWLPELNMFAEVKGSTESGELWKVLESASHLSENGSDVLFLGHLPHPDRYRVPSRLHFYKGELFVTPWIDLNGGNQWSDACYSGWVAASDDGKLHNAAESTWASLLDMANPMIPDFFFRSPERARQWYHLLADNRDRFERGYEEARSARF